MPADHLESSITKFSLHFPGTVARRCDVTISWGCVASGQAARLQQGAGAPFSIWDQRVWELWGKRLEAVCVPWSAPQRRLTFAACEASKRLAAVEGLASELVRSGADRQSFLVAIGGGVTGDVVGFLASIYMRGVPYVQVPTTLLAQVDSGLGGKTGVDLEEGKNLLGTFHQPDAVWVDPSLLATLPPDEFRQGMAEVIKMALLGDPDLWQFLETRNESLARREPGALTHVIGRCCRLKAEIVEADEREGGKRRILNLGHTVGHALERLSGYRMRHGDAVAIGMVCAARLAERLAGRQTDTLTRLEALCTAWALPTRLTPEYSPHAILEAMKADKKSLSGKLHFLVPFQVGQVVDCESPDPAAVDATLRDPRIRAERL